MHGLPYVVSSASAGTHTHASPLAKVRPTRERAACSALASRADSRGTAASSASAMASLSAGGYAANSAVTYLPPSPRPTLR